MEGSDEEKEEGGGAEGKGVERCVGLGGEGKADWKERLSVSGEWGDWKEGHGGSD